MNKHTPGPWDCKPFLTPDDDDDPMMVYTVVAGDLQTRFDELPTDDDGEYDPAAVDAIHAENAANARLIAAAPELLEALAAIVAKFVSDPDDLETMDAGIKIARAAIAKATGI